MIKEALLTVDPNQINLFPEQPHQLVMKLYDKHRQCFWTEHEVSYDTPAVWNALNLDEQYFLKHVLTFFARGDGIVMENLSSRFLNEIEMMEVRVYYAFQMAMEGVHAITYTQMLTSVINDSEERHRLRTAVDEMPAVAAKTEWALDWMSCERPFGERLVAFAVVEGIFFSGSFCAIYWLKKRGLMPGLCQANELIARDEGLHCDFACLLFTHLLYERPSAKRVHQIVSAAVDIEKAFVSDALPVGLIGMNAHLMCQYIEYVADHLLQSLELPVLYGTPNPFSWMELISLQGKTNFFEKRVTEYQKAGERVFSLEEDF